MTNSWNVALLSPPYATLTYGVPDDLPLAMWRPGLRVLAPMGAKNALRVGVLLGAADAMAGAAAAGKGDGSAGGDGAGGGDGDGADGKAITLKPLVWPMERTPLLDAAYMEMVAQLAVRQMLTPGRVLGSFLPLALRTTRIVFQAYEGGRPRGIKPQALQALDRAGRAALAALWDAGRVEVRTTGETAGTQEHCTLTQDPPWPVRPGAKRQIQILEYLLEQGHAARGVLLRDLGQSAAPVLGKLITQGLVQVGPMPDDVCLEPDDEDGPGVGVGDRATGGNAFALSAAQRAALDSLAGALDAAPDGPGSRTRLLHGVTGSGKTAVYLELAKACLARGRSVLLLAPEVALAMQLRRAAAAFFPDRAVHFYHGYQGVPQREKTFLALARSCEPAVIVGTRSALFLPAPGLGLVVLDEEHDSSFKQDERLTYQAKEVAYFRVRQTGGLLVLGSATPDVKSFYAAREGRIPVLAMDGRVGGGTPPDIRLVDIRDSKATEHLLAPESLDLLKETVARGDQAIIMLNRRGYAPLMYCLDCGTVAKCPHCAIGLTYHKGRERLVCHYCGLSEPFPVVCATCGGCQYLPMGEGTEKIAETLAASLPDGTRVLRMDRDSTRRPGRLEEILRDFGDRKAQVLVGTQMLSKGHHFPDVTLVIVADGDLGLNVPDYRAAERTFQLLLQVAGRAGRGDKPGVVLLQTRDTNHYCWDFVRRADYEGFYEQEVALRRKRRYPPFVKLALIRMSYPMDWAEGPGRVAELTAAVRRAGKKLGVMVLGPAPAPLPMLRGRKRFNCLLKAETWPPVRALYAHVEASLPSSTHVRLSLDLDPVNMM
ncbi:MAG: primosomal protein N' [Desulfovibrionaceae bacterium]